VENANDGVLRLDVEKWSLLPRAGEVLIQPVIFSIFSLAIRFDLTINLLYTC
jgi:hypothetical protein